MLKKMGMSFLVEKKAPAGTMSPSTMLKQKDTFSEKGSLRKLKVIFSEKVSTLKLTNRHTFKTVLDITRHIIIKK